MELLLQATGSEKWIRVTDLLARPTPKTHDPKLTQLNQATPWSITSTAADAELGKVRIEVARQEHGTYAEHDSEMGVEEGELYFIDDSKLPSATRGARA
jgi:hypothetical protein